MPSESKINQWETKSQQSQIQKKEADKTTHCRLQQQKWKNYESETGLSEGYRWWTLNQATYKNSTAPRKKGIKLQVLIQHIVMTLQKLDR